MADFDLGPTRGLRADERSDAAPGYMDLARQSIEDAKHVRNLSAFDNNMSDEYDRINDRIKQATGKDLFNPYRPGGQNFPAPEFDAWGVADHASVLPQAVTQKWEQAVSDLQRQHPDAMSWDGLAAEPRRNAFARMREVSEKTAQMGEHFSGFDPGYWGATFAGGLVGQMSSPVDAASNLVGLAHTKAAYSLVKNAAINAGTNAAVQAPLSGAKQLDYKEAGLPYGWKVWAEEVGMAGVVGGALDLGIRGPSRAIISRFGRDVPADAMFSRNTPRGGFALDAIETPQLPTPRAAAEPRIDPELVKKAEAGDIEATRKLAEQTGVIHDPAVKGAFDYLDGGGKVTDEALARLESMGVARWDGMRMLAQAIEGRLPEAPKPLVAPEHPPMLDEARTILTQHADKYEKLLQDAAPKLDDIDPRLSRYVQDAVDAGLGRVVPEVQNALDGHVEAFVARMKTLADQVGIERLVAEGKIHTSKNALEVGGLMREHPDLATTALDAEATPVAVARSIAGMDQAAFDGVMRGDVHPEVAALVADRIPQQHQARVVSDLSSNHPRSLTEARAMIDMLAPVEREAGVPLDGGTRIADPAGPEAKRQVEALKQEAGKAYEDAVRPIEERIKLESEVEDIKGELAKLETEPKPKPSASGDFLDAVFEGDKAKDVAALQYAKTRGKLHEAETRLAEAKLALDPSADGLSLYRMTMRAIDVRREQDVMRGFSDAVALAERILPDGSKVEIKTDLQYEGRPLDGITYPTSGDIQLARSAMEPAAIIGHEAVHALRVKGLITPNEIKALAKLARDEGTFTKEAEYRDAYKSQANLDALIDEEAAASYIEARIKGKAEGPQNTAVARIQQFMERLKNLWNGYGFQSSQDVVNALLNGDMARRTPQIEKVQAWMRQEDITAVAQRERAPDQAATIEQPKAGPAARVGSEVTTTIDTIDLPAGSVGKVVAVDDARFNAGLSETRLYTIEFGEGNTKQTRLIQDGHFKAPAATHKTTMFAFAGERARTADLDALAKAKEMTASGLDRAKVWNATGWFQGVDGKWRFEIDDSKSYGDLSAARAEGFAPNKTVPLDHVLGHKDLYAAYPDLENTGIRYRDFPDGYDTAFASYADKSDTVVLNSRNRNFGNDDVARSSILHEVQHRTQAKEGFERGGSEKSGVAAYNEISARINRLIDEAGGSLRGAGPEVRQQVEALKAEQKALPFDPREYYKRLAGEAEARLVQKRMDLTADERRARPPWLDYDVPEEQQIVRGMSEPMFAMVDTNVGREMKRDLDKLGYFSGALEAAKRLKQAKGTPEQMLSQLRAGGAKAGEIEATGLGKFLEGRPSVTRDEIVGHLEGNRLGLNEVEYRTPTKQDSMNWADLLDLEAWRPGTKPAVKEELLDLVSAVRKGDINAADFQMGMDHAGLMPDTVQAVRRAGGDAGIARESTKWSAHSLDPSNPTYRETVLHLPTNEAAGRAGFEAANPGKSWDALSDADRSYLARKYGPPEFQQHHFPNEPNVVGHMMTSMTKHEGKPVYTIDQIQSDWGQKLRDGGVRDEAKIKGLEKQLADLRRQYDELTPKEKFEPHDYEPYEEVPFFIEAPEGMPAGLRMTDRAAAIVADRELVRAELETATASASGHPLVNTTDQWSNTTLRRAIRQAAEADAEFVAIPHGDTVLSYNPGDEAGMRGFYGSRSAEGIVPKNLRKMLEKIDGTIKPQRIEQLETSAGPQGWNTAQSYPFNKSQTGFTLFPLTEKVKASVKQDGLPLFAMKSEPVIETVNIDRITDKIKMQGNARLADGTSVYVKVGLGSAAASRATVAREVLGNEIARLIDPTMPRSRVVQVGDQLAVAVDVVKGDHAPQFTGGGAFRDGQPRSGRLADRLDVHFDALTVPNQKALVRQAAIDTFLLNNDSHGAQFLINERGQVVGIDKENAFTGHSSEPITNRATAKTIRADYIEGQDFVRSMVEHAKESRKSGDGALADEWNATVRAIGKLKKRDLFPLVRDATAIGKFEPYEVDYINGALLGGRGWFGGETSMPLFAMRAYHGGPDFNEFKTPAFFSKSVDEAKSYREFGGIGTNFNGAWKPLGKDYKGALYEVDLADPTKNYDIKLDDHYQDNQRKAIAEATAEGHKVITINNGHSVEAVALDKSAITIVRKNGVPVSGNPMFTMRDAEPREPEPMIKADMAFVDRLSQMKDLIEACRA